MGKRDLRKGRFSSPGQVYSITFTTFNRMPILTDFAIGCSIGRATLSAALIKDHQLMCWVLMPDHMHLLVQLGHAETLSDFVRNYKSVTSRKVKAITSLRSPLWTDGFHDRAIRRESDILTVARYIVANPLRAGLISSVRKYPFWDAIWLADGNSRPAFQADPSYPNRDC